MTRRAIPWCAGLLAAGLLGASLTAPRALAADDDKTVAARDLNAFAAELYGRVRQQPGNLFFSPESIATALAMSLAGARGDTASEMAAALRFTLPPDRLHPVLGALLRDRNAAHDGYQLKEADRLWGQNGYTFRDNFLALLKDDYSAGLVPLDFKSDAEASRQTINQWVTQQTENKITDLIAPGVLTADTRLVLTNAIYFKASWAVPFKVSETSDEDFHAAGRTVTTPMMHREDGFGYLDGGSFQALELPYRNGELSMVVFLPKAPDGLPGFEQMPLDSELPAWLGQMRYEQDIVVTLPKFTIRATFQLNAVLQAMGMKHAFDRDTADFSGMSDAKDLYLSAVIHQAFVAIDEQDTEAAAATAVVAPTTSALQHSEPPPPIVFRADHPFMFLIRENRSGVILFMGRIVAPSA